MVFVKYSNPTPRYMYLETLQGSLISSVAILQLSMDMVIYLSA